MIFIIGGSYQGKLDFAREHCRLSENEIEIPEQEVIERKKEVIVPKKNSFISSNDYLKNTEDVIIKTYSDSRTPPPRNDPEPYQVYY